MTDPLATAKALYLEAIRDGNAAAAIAKYSGERYTQHSTPVKDGPEGFVEFFDGFLQRNPVRDITIHRAWRDGPYVFLHVEQDLNDGEFRYVTADIFDTDENGKLVEHWDIIEEIVEEPVSGHTQLGGPTVPIELDRTRENKRLVQRFMDEVLIGGQHGKLADYVSTESFVQHSPHVADGFHALAAFLTGTTDEPGRPMYERVHLLIGCGNFVAALSKMRLGATDMAVIDLFRIATGQIVEHWDVMEEIAPPDTWVNSGKF